MTQIPGMAQIRFGAINTILLPEALSCIDDPRSIFKLPGVKTKIGMPGFPLDRFLSCNNTQLPSIQLNIPAIGKEMLIVGLYITVIEQSLSPIIGCQPLVPVQLRRLEIIKETPLPFPEKIKPGCIPVVKIPFDVL